MRPASWCLLAFSLGLVALASLAEAQQGPLPAASAQAGAPSPPLPTARASGPVASVGAAAVQAFPGLGVTRFTLENGLVVQVQEDHRSPIVWTRVTYKVGGKDDPHNKEGLAQAMGRILGLFSTRHTASKEQLAQLGMRSARWWRTTEANRDRTVVDMRAPSEGLELALWMQADSMAFHDDAITQTNLDSVRQGIQQQAGWGKRLEPHVAELVQEAIYPRSYPYRNHLLGEGDSVLNLTRTDLRNYSRARLVPNNAILTIVGDVNAEAARALVEKYFTTIVAGPALAKAEVALPEPTRERTLAIDASVSEPYFSFTWVTPGYLTREDQALDLVARLLLAPGKSLTKRLTEAKITGPLYGRQESAMLNSTFVLAGSILKGHTLAEVRAILDEEMGKLAAGIDAAELAPIQTGMKLQIAELFDSPEPRSHELANFEHITGQSDAAARYWAGYSNLRREEVSQVVRTKLTAARRLVAEVTPVSNAPSEGQLHEESQ